ncbi:cytochrome P450 [Streptomyces alkaliterrae]|uniref:Cytochrome P450 n=1 Tax=Streptomyces alkaliterrae TaxID=2213162 RepID=A0A5P0YNE1_9ACTN|nr:cytochrome P450 [Streptomyces alkaliterrae]MBB1258460.1 cytochrome P450 [Streptomyces alkaliterrae]MQS01826.1 cytochrome P450 [Streptomyces alkaliterrae]
MPDNQTLDSQENVLDWPFKRTCPMSVPPELAELRAQPPCAVRIPEGAVPARRAWLVTRHADVRQALMDPRMSADEGLEGAPVRIQLPPGERPSSFLRMDPPEHGRLRTLITSEFTARRVRTLTPGIQQLIDELLDGLAAQDRPADLCENFSTRLPTLVIARLLGVPAERSHEFVALTRVTIGQGDPERSYHAYLELTGILRGLIEHKRHEPADDIMSKLAGHVNDGRITVDEAMGVSTLVLVAGHETTTNQIALSTLSLLLDDSLREEVLADDGKLLPQYIEESMRYWSISQDAILRMCLEDMEVGGVRMAKGDAVVVSIPGGNWDEEVFPDPGRLDVHRDTSEHLQWGIGPHYCLGAPLARLEIELALRSLFTRFPGLRLACAREDVPFRRETVFYGLHGLPVTW